MVKPDMPGVLKHEVSKCYLMQDKRVSLFMFDIGPRR